MKYTTLQILSLFWIMYVATGCMLTDVGQQPIAKKIGNKWGFVDKTGKTVIPPRYTQVKPFSEGLAAVQVKASDFNIPVVAVEGSEEDVCLWGYIDNQGKFVIEPAFGEAGSFKDGYAEVELPSVSAMGNRRGATIKIGGAGRFKIDKQGRINCEYSVID